MSSQDVIFYNQLCFPQLTAFRNRQQRNERKYITIVKQNVNGLITIK